jgi:5'/3'-nucleotidase SurE
LARAARAAVVVFALVLALTGVPASSVTTAATLGVPHPLRILLTNDDGWNAPGLQAMKAALEGAGHQVTVVAPSRNRSGSSVAFTADFFTQLDVVQQSANVWSVSGTPADAVLVGLRVVMKDGPPDLVVSGANFGQNIGRTVNSSGTVGAAIMASQLDKPAISVSVGVDPSEFGSNFPSTFAAFPRAGAFTVNVITELEKSATSASILPPRQLLNINYPARPTANITGIAHTTVGRTMDVVPNYVSAGAGKYTIVPELRNDADTSDSDVTKFRQGYITVTAVDGDWTADGISRATIMYRLYALKVA